MTDKTHALILWRTEHSLLSVEDLASASGVQTGIVETFVRLRLIEPSALIGFDQLFPASTVDRLQRIVHLRQDLGVNLAGVAVILQMSEHMEALQKEVEALREHSGLSESRVYGNDNGESAGDA
jgi:MerR family transcriptional regulator/heat shock protein HspR